MGCVQAPANWPAWNGRKSSPGELAPVLFDSSDGVGSRWCPTRSHAHVYDDGCCDDGTERCPERGLRETAVGDGRASVIPTDCFARSMPDRLTRFAGRLGHAHWCRLVIRAKAEEPYSNLAIVHCERRVAGGARLARSLLLRRVMTDMHTHCPR